MMAMETLHSQLQSAQGFQGMFQTTRTATTMIRILSLELDAAKVLLTALQMAFYTVIQIHGKTGTIAAQAAHALIQLYHQKTARQNHQQTRMDLLLHIPHSELLQIS